MSVRVAVISGDGVGYDEAARGIRTAVASALTNPRNHTRDLGGTATTTDLATAVLQQMESTS